MYQLLWLITSLKKHSSPFLGRRGNTEDKLIRVNSSTRPYTSDTAVFEVFLAKKWNADIITFEISSQTQKYICESALHHLSVRPTTRNRAASRQSLRERKRKRGKKMTSQQHYIIYQDISSICVTSISPERGGGMWKQKHGRRAVRSAVQEYPRARH